MKITLKTLHIAVFALLIIFYSFSAARVKKYRACAPSPSRASAMLVAPEIIKIAAGEFKGILADYLLLKASVFLGGRYEAAENDWIGVYNLFKQSLALDPYFFQTCYYIQATLPWEAKMPQKAVELLEISRKHRYWDWQPGFYAGFDYCHFLNDNLTASKILMETATRPNAPALLGLLGARLAQKGGKAEAGIIFLQAMYKNTDNKETRRQITVRLDALKGVLNIEKAIEKFISKFGHSPQSLDELVETGIVAQLPKNPYKKYFDYQDGVVGF